MRISCLVTAIIVGSSLLAGSVLAADEEDNKTTMFRVKSPCATEDRNLAAVCAWAKSWTLNPFAATTWECNGACATGAGLAGTCKPGDGGPPTRNSSPTTSCDCAATPIPCAWKLNGFLGLFGDWECSGRCVTGAGAVGTCAPAGGGPSIVTGRPIVACVCNLPPPAPGGGGGPKTPPKTDVIIGTP